VTIRKTHRHDRSCVSAADEFLPVTAPRAGEVMTVSFTLDGQDFTALNGGPEFRFNESVSMFVNCADQAEVDRYWTALTDGGEEGQCGWCKDRFGLSWQVIPEGLGAALTHPDPERSQRAVAAMMTMSKIDLAALTAAANG
jgi:predicted 3-demethylubiquinone-9 3-methyltransferase (glyoxalase superfamily)